MMFETIDRMRFDINTSTTIVTYLVMCYNIKTMYETN